jgi:DNA primase
MINSPVAQIKERLTIEDVVSSYIKLERAGANFKAKCPFHNEKTPSFFISPDRGSYYCFGCSAKGDVFSFVEEFEGLDFKGALKVLAERAGVTLGAFNREAESEKEKLYRVMEESTKFFCANLDSNNEVQKYLKDRGLNEKSIKDWRIGFVGADWRLLYDYLKKQNFTDKEIERAGLTKASEKGYYDRFRGRIMFPIADSSGRVIAFSGRIFVDDEKSAKYLNSPETPIFNKSSVFYGIDKAKESIRKNNFSILVEGQMDLVLSHQAGFRNTVATSGTALSDSTVSKENAISNLGLVRRLSPNIVLAFDADKAGLGAANRAGKIALALGMDVKVAEMPDGMDPADLISKSGVDAWKEAVRKSKHIIEFLLDKVIKSGAGDERKIGREVKEKILPYIASLESSIEKAHFLKKVSDVSGIALSALEEDLRKVVQDTKQENVEIKIASQSSGTVFRKDYILRRLLGIALWQKSLEKPTIDTGSLLQQLSEILNTDQDKLLEKNSGDKEDLIFEAEVFYKEDTGIAKDVAEMLYNLKEEFLKEELSRKMRELYLAEEAKDTTKSNEILKECQIISNKIEQIKNESR